MNVHLRPPHARRRFLTELIELGHRLGANSTPTWFLETGERYSGAMPLEDVRRLLDAASPVKR